MRCQPHDPLGGVELLEQALTLIGVGDDRRRDLIRQQAGIARLHDLFDLRAKVWAQALDQTAQPDRPSGQHLGRL